MEVRAQVDAADLTLMRRRVAGLGLLDFQGARDCGRSESDEEGLARK